MKRNNHQMKSGIWMAIIAVFLITIKAASAQGLVTLMSKLERTSANKWEIAFVLTNETRAPVTLVKDDLPWGPASGALILVTTASGEILKQSFPLIQANTSNTIMIHPQSNVRGTIDLTGYFSKFDEYRKKRELIIFWTYKPRYFLKSHLIDQERVGGWFAISPQRSTFIGTSKNLAPSVLTR